MNTSTIAIRLLWVVMAATSFMAVAQEFPSRPVRFLIPLAAGGGGDITVRAVSQKLNAAWGQSVVVDNRPGGTGAIALETVARAQPDGYTIVMISGTHTARRATHHGRLPYDLIRDFAPVTQMTQQSYVLVLHPTVAAEIHCRTAGAGESETRQPDLRFGRTGQPAAISRGRYWRP